MFKYSESVIDFILNMFKSAMDNSQIRHNWEVLIYASGSRCWHKNGKLHRDDDLPAVIHSDGTKEWWFNGLRHRGNDQPAIICSNGFMEWWDYGVLHRTGRNPAVIGREGEHEWWKDGVKYNPPSYYIDWRKEGF